MAQPSTHVTTEYIMTLHAPLKAAQIVDDDFQIYTVLPGGWVNGPSIRGELIQPAADWIRVMPNGTQKIDVRESIKADDGSIIFMSITGRIVIPDKLAEKYKAGEVIGPDELYFVIAPTFETSSRTYGWLNDIVAIGKMVSSKEGENGHVTYDIFAVK